MSITQDQTTILFRETREAMTRARKHMASGDPLMAESARAVAVAAAARLLTGHDHMLFAERDLMHAWPTESRPDGAERVVRGWWIKDGKGPDAEVVGKVLALGVGRRPLTWYMLPAVEGHDLDISDSQARDTLLGRCAAMQFGVDSLDDWAPAVHAA